MLVTNTVGSQIQGMNSSIVKMQEMNEKMKEEGENRYKQFNERITNMDRKILDMDEKYENRSEDNKILRGFWDRGRVCGNRSVFVTSHRPALSHARMLSALIDFAFRI